MRYQRLGLNPLTALRALLTETSVTRSGERLHLSQSAMSGILARLREYFDNALIVPVGRRMELTPLAESLGDKVGDLLLIDVTLGTKPEFDPATSRRHFILVASDFAVGVLLLDVLREVHVQAPGLTLEFRHPGATSYQELENGELDFLVIPESYTPPTRPSLRLFQDT